MNASGAWQGTRIWSTRAKGWDYALVEKDGIKAKIEGRFEPMTLDVIVAVIDGKPTLIKDRTYRLHDVATFEAEVPFWLL